MDDVAYLKTRLEGWLAAFNSRNLEEYSSFYHEDVTLHGYAAVPLKKSGLRGWFNSFFSCFEVESRFDEQLWDGTRVAIRWTCNALQTAEYEGITPSGRRVSWPGISVMHWKDGQIIERWTSQDMAYVTEQLKA